MKEKNLKITPKKSHKRCKQPTIKAEKGILWVDNKKIADLNTESISDYIYYNNKKYKSIIFHNGTYYVLITGKDGYFYNVEKILDN